jgi:pimeloyl-ACP methyl ester carboxylesterase
MRSYVLSIIPVLAARALAAPASSEPASSTSFEGVPSSYLEGFKNPKIESSVGGKATCISGIVDVTASATNIHINYEGPANNIEVTEFMVQAVEIDSTLVKRLVGAPTNVSGTFGISSHLCFPNGSKLNGTTLQVLSHGLGCDGSYWNNAPNYSYVDYAAEQGYTTFYYDRLGVGLSDHPDPIQVVQRNLELAILHELIQDLRAGSISGQKFKHLVGVGHSFGSFQTFGITSLYPNDLDAAVLTGFSNTTAGFPDAFSAFDLTIASQDSPTRFGNLSNGYLTGASIRGGQFAFFRWPGFHPAMLDLLWANKQGITIGEYLSNSFFPAATNFTGPLDVVNGDGDNLNCYGNCSLPYNQAVQTKEAFYPSVSDFDWYFSPESGHFLNYHYSAPSAYKHIHNFIKKHGF